MYGKVQENPNLKTRLFIQEVPMELQNYLLIGLQLIIGKLMVFLHAMEFYLIMKVQDEVKLL